MKHENRDFYSNRLGLAIVPSRHRTMADHCSNVRCKLEAVRVTTEGNNCLALVYIMLKVMYTEISNAFWQLYCQNTLIGWISDLLWVLTLSFYMLCCALLLVAKLGARLVGSRLPIACYECFSFWSTIDDVGWPTFIAGFYVYSIHYTESYPWMVYVSQLKAFPYENFICKFTQENSISYVKLIFLW